MPQLPRRGFDVFAVNDDVSFSRLGTNVSVKGRDGQNKSSDSVEANLLYEILKVMRKK